MEVRNKRLSDEEFFREREEVLAEWPTGRGIDLLEAIEYHKSQPKQRSYAWQLARIKQEKTVLLHGAAGADTLDRHIELIRYLQDEGHADAVSTWIDALTRNHRYAEADEALKKAESTDRVMLNGFPVVHYGVAATRKMTESIMLPACVYANGPDMRLIAEIILAGGHTATSLGGAICAFWNYTSDLTLERVIRNYQYHLRLEGYYEEHGVPIVANQIGTIAHLTPPSLKTAPTVIETLFAAEQGVKHLKLQDYPWGNLTQDVASAFMLRKLGREYLDKLGYKDTQVYVASYHPSNIKFPEDHARAFAIIGWSPLVAVLAGCDIASFMTIDEGLQIPRMEQNAATHRHVRMMLNFLKDQEIDMLSDKAVMAEAEIIGKETRAIIDKVLEMGDGDPVIGACRAIEAGVMDNPFSTTQNTHSRVIGVRDAQGAVRYFDHGNLPFTSEMVEFHKEKIAERGRKEGREISYDAVIGDAFAFSQGQMISKPAWQLDKITAAAR